MRDETPKDKATIRELIQTIADASDKMLTAWNANESIPVNQLSKIESSIDKLNRMVFFK